MVYEQVLSILFAVGVGAAIIVYAAKPRSRSVSGSMAPAVASFAQTEVVQAAPMPQITAIETPVVETSIASDTQSVVEVAPVVAEVAAAGSSEAAPISSATGIDVSAVAPAPIAESPATASHSSTRSHRAPKRKSTTTKSHTRSSTRPGSTRPR